METTAPAKSTSPLEGLTLQHPELHELFMHSMRIPQETLATLLVLPKETLAADLRAILRHAVERFDLYERASQVNGWSWETMSAPMHAIMLLSELPASENLDAILDFLAADEDPLDFHLGDQLTEFMWEPIAKLGTAPFDRITAFFRTPCPQVYSRVMAAHGVALIAHTWPERMAEVEAWIEEQLRYFSEVPDEDPAIETEVIDVLIGDAIELRLNGLLPLVERLFELDRTSDFNYGPIETVRELFANPQPFRKDVVLPLAERYADQVKFQEMTERNMAEEKERAARRAQGLDEPPAYDHALIPQEPYVREEPKTGRNEPCPCGSGKKYKKCHGG